MATDVVMPQMGESIAEGTITKWLVKVGETVERDQPLFEISTDKVDAEIPSPASGVLLEVKYDEGATVEVDQVVARIGEEGEAAGEPTEEKDEGGETAEEATAAAEAEEQETPEAEAEEEETDRASEEGDGEEPRAARAEPSGDGEEPEDQDLAERLRRFSSPVVRKIAREHDVDISNIEGTGIHGRVTRSDIEAYLEDRTKAPAREEKPAAAAAAPSARPGQASGLYYGDFHVPAYTEGENVEIEPMSKIRQITAAHMSYSKHTSAHVTTAFHIDMSRVHAVRERAKRRFAEANGTKLTYMPFIFKAVAAALKRNRKVNAAIDGTDIVYKNDINLGMAVALDRGLMVPVLRNADRLSLVGLAQTANDLADRVRTKKIMPDELKGGTFTITNPGVFGSLFGTPVINQPQVAILGVGTIEKRPVVVTDELGYDAIAIRVMSYFAITYDHRLVDGADADHFMNDVKKTLQEDTWSELDAYL